MPTDVASQMGPISSIMGEIMLIAMSSTTADPMVLRETADFTVRPRLLTMPGVAQVIPIGGEVRQYRIVPDPLRMAGLDVTIEDIERAIRQFGSNTGGGFVDLNAREFLIRNIGRTTRIEDLRNLVVAYRDETVISLSQVATVDFAARTKRGDAGFKGKPAVILGVQKQPGADTVQITREIEALLPDLQRVMPDGVTVTDVQFRQATFIETSIANVMRVLVEALVIVAVVLFVFLLNWRTTLISIVAIPGVDAGDGAGFPDDGPWHQHDDAGRACDRDRRTGRRCGGGCGEYLPPAGSVAGIWRPRSSQRLGGGGGCVERGAVGHRLCDGDHRAGVRAAVCACRASRGGCSRRWGSRTSSRSSPASRSRSQ